MLNPLGGLDSGNGSELGPTFAVEIRAESSPLRKLVSPANKSVTTLIHYNMQLRRVRKLNFESMNLNYVV